MVENKGRISEPGSGRDSLTGSAATERKSVDQVIDAKGKGGGSGDGAKKDPAGKA
ncbi:hypothetical protein ABRQ22_06615 [Cellulosimicrobium sp. ES-005]|uniref:CsbD family protein n=1 Tax=Cellulosimicrobium sp. ES-005 TaxID=3163031 RepID=A0AAU8G4P3_9MICO|nr:hypothetical protein [Sphaerisporangium cinnabarinum]